VQPNAYSPFDWKRILIGSAPLGFALEVLARTAITYVLLMALLRLLGKRMSGQVATLELGVMIVLGAIASGAFQVANRGLLPGATLMLTALALQRGLASAGARWLRFERWTQGGTKMLVRDGALQLQELRKIGLSQEQLFSALRSRGIRHLGEVRRVYQETTGDFSILRQEPPLAGLPVFPNWDQELHKRAHSQAGLLACVHCGFVQGADPEHFRCSRCGHSKSQAAVAEAAGKPSDGELERGRHHAA
jgi:uncharacterized membrane protein YcaP (DUF421 family)